MVASHLPEAHTSPVELRTLKGGEIVPHLEDLARLRMEVFREWPYLYDGTPEEEREYLAAFQSAASAVLVVLLDGERVVGASSAVSLAEEQTALREPFESAGLAPAEWFYCGSGRRSPDAGNRPVGVREGRTRAPVAGPRAFGMLGGSKSRSTRARGRPRVPVPARARELTRP